MAYRPTIMGTHGMVATEHYLSALIGTQVLQQGGNADDAAVAAIFAEGVLNPHMHTLGGEVPMLIYTAQTGQVAAINGNTAAPQRATLEWFAEHNLDLIPGDGLLAAGVPAACDALITALGSFGTMALEQVLQRSDEIAFLSMRGAASLSRKIKENKPAARLSRELTGIVLDVPLPQPEPDLSWKKTITIPYARM